MAQHLYYFRLCLHHATTLKNPGTLTRYTAQAKIHYQKALQPHSQHNQVLTTTSGISLNEHLPLIRWPCDSFSTHLIVVLRPLPGVYQGFHALEGSSELILSLVNQEKHLPLMSSWKYKFRGMLILLIKFGWGEFNGQINLGNAEVSAETQVPLL